MTLPETAPDEERLLVRQLTDEPEQRAPFVRLAEYCERHGESAAAADLYRGNLPGLFIDRHAIPSVEMLAPPRLDGCERLAWFPPERVALTPPANEDAHRNSVFEAVETRGGAEFVDRLVRATVVYDGKNKLVLNERGQGCSMHSTPNGLLLERFARDGKTPSRHLAGTTLMLAAHNAANFYHWFHDVLPALGQLEAAGVPLASIDHLVVDERLLPFQRESLAALGIDEATLVTIPAARLRLHCESFLMCRVNNSMGMQQSVRHLAWLRSRFLPESAAGEREGIALAVARDSRGFADAERVHATLRDKGYRLVRMEAHDLVEQIELFSRADVVVAPHGAALALLAFCRPGTRVHEFYGEHVQPCFWAIASQLGLDYRNHNGSPLSDGEVTHSNKGLASRLGKCVPVREEWLARL